MKKHQNRHGSPPPYWVDNNDKQRIQSSVFTVLYNLTGILVYGIFLTFLFDGALTLITFSVMAVLQVIICTLIAFRYNNKEWLISALLIFVIACIVIVYETT